MGKVVVALTLKCFTDHEENIDGSVIINGKKYSLNNVFHEMKLRPKGIEQKSPSFTSCPEKISFRISRKTQARFSKLNRQFKKELKRTKTGERDA